MACRMQHEKESALALPTASRASHCHLISFLTIDFSYKANPTIGVFFNCSLIFFYSLLHEKWKNQRNTIFEFRSSLLDVLSTKKLSTLLTFTCEIKYDMFDHPFDSRIKLTHIPLITKLTSMYEMHPTHNFFHYIYVMSMVSSKWKKVNLNYFQVQFAFQTLTF